MPAFLRGFALWQASGGGATLPRSAESFRDAFDCEVRVVPHLSVRDFDHLKARRSQALDAPGVELMVDQTRVESLALHLHDERDPDRAEVHPTNPGDAVTDIHLSLQLGQPRPSGELEESCLGTGLGRDVIEAPFAQDPSHHAGAGTAPLRHLPEHCVETGTVHEAH